MERFWRLVLISCLAIFGSACSKDDENTENDVESPAATYYVKYITLFGIGLRYDGKGYAEFLGKK